MISKAPAAVSSGNITLKHVELCQFRRIAKVNLDIDKKTTILVGANNSGKTSILIALRQFLSDTPSVGAFDISLSQWPALRALGKLWEVLAEDPATAASLIEDWNEQLTTLLASMPTLDLWFNAEEGMYHFVSPFLSTFNWYGGAVGVRLRLEPASSVEELQRLAWNYREARAPVKDLSKDSHAWPMDLLDYWLRYPGDLGRIQAYKLDAQNNPMEKGKEYKTQVLASNATPVDRTHLSRLVRVDYVPAQRGLGAEEADTRSGSAQNRVGLFSNQLLKFARQHLSVATTGHGHRADLVEAVANAQTDLDKKIRDALAPSVEDVKILGYPGLHDPHEIHFRTRIQTADLLDHGTAVQYRMSKDADDDLLPEYSIGLGYQNLQSLSYQLVSFRAARLNPPTGSPAPVHIVMIEEPEAHLHVQVQRIFPAKAHKLISPTLPGTESLKSQLLISTHSSHLAHAESFTHLRYLRRVPRSNTVTMPSTEVVNLGDAFGDDDETRIFAERYFRVQHTDLLFADAAVFVEGAAERMLVPLFIEQQFDTLSSRYVSILDIGGSHAHRLRPLVERLRIPTVIITDIDPVQESRDANDKVVLSAVANEGQPGLKCGNATLRTWHPKLTELDDFKAPAQANLVWSEVADCKVRFTWQLPVKEADGCWPSSFEDSLILSNIPWFKALGKERVGLNGVKIKKPIGALGKVVKAVNDAKSNTELAKKLHTLMHSSFSKGDFSATIFEKMASGEVIVCPNYIADSLQWLQDQFNPEPETYL
ncbi:AAA family ATPase [Pseudomonas mohnii]|uniref:AAA family ATPase n=1 Tax=Pseudomonas mohnii TaxID=395600 RepID=UPI0018C795D2|nr:AAA family ATPase [Pseudomonas mohnii]MBH8609962.1 AAA family ATPase [Pseudomonas mohnii]